MKISIEIIIIVTIIIAKKSNQQTISREEYQLDFQESKLDEQGYKQLKQYQARMKNAGKDQFQYTKLQNGFLSTQYGRAMYYYSKQKVQKNGSNYSIEFINPKFSITKILIDPCRNKRYRSLKCCDKSNQGACQDHTSVQGGSDLWVAWFLNGYTVQCGNQFAESSECGTFLEIHRPTDGQVIQEVRITRNYEDGFGMESISTTGICAGRYEVWYVVRTRKGRFLQFVKPFYVQWPSCSCQIVRKLGYECQD